MSEWNEISVEHEGDKTRLVQCLGYPPIKFINPRPQSGCCQIYISNYGGGLVDGDRIAIKVRAQEHARLYLGTQSSTKVYKSEGKGGCIQETLGWVRAHAFVVVAPDPIVPFAGSRYRQNQVWEVHEDGEFILLDWLQPGRLARGEIFAYSRFQSELRITRPGGKPVLLERFDLEPEKQEPRRCGQFGPFQSFLNIYLIGPKLIKLMETLEEKIWALNKLGQNSGNIESAPLIWVSLGKREEEGYVIRAMGGERHHIQPLHDLLFTALADAAWLGFNPWDRRW